MRSYAVIDFETTGLGPPAGRIIEVGAVLIRDGEVAGTFSELMHPGFRIPSFITGLTGITDAMVRGKPRPEEMMPRLRAFLGDAVCVAHNASFDRRFFAAEMERAGEGHERRFLCSLLLARRLLPEAASHKLGALVDHLRLTPPAGMRAHRALADALMTVELWKRLLADLRPRLDGREPDADLLAAICAAPKGQVQRCIERAAGAGREASRPLRSAELIRELGLQPHPEGGHYRETFRSPLAVATPRGERSASTAIWFLLRAGEVSRWHRVLGDECWHWHEGAEVELLVCERPGAPVSSLRLGPAGGGALPQHVVPAGWWQAAIPAGPYALVGCTVAPGFDFADFTLADPAGPEAAWLLSQADPRLLR